MSHTFEVSKRVEVKKGKKSERGTIIEVHDKYLMVIMDSEDELSKVSVSKCTKARGRASNEVIEKAQAFLGGSSKKSKSSKKKSKSEGKDKTTKTSKTKSKKSKETDDTPPKSKKTKKSKKKSKSRDSEVESKPRKTKKKKSRG